MPVKPHCPECGQKLRQFGSAWKCATHGKVNNPLMPDPHDQETAVPNRARGMHVRWGKNR